MVQPVELNVWLPSCGYGPIFRNHKYNNPYYNNPCKIICEYSIGREWCSIDGRYYWETINDDSHKRFDLIFKEFFVYIDNHASFRICFNNRLTISSTWNRIWNSIFLKNVIELGG